VIGDIEVEKEMEDMTDALKAALGKEDKQTESEV
jgi:hypothetical protein